MVANWDLSRLISKTLQKSANPFSQKTPCFTIILKILERAVKYAAAKELVKYERRGQKYARREQKYAAVKVRKRKSGKLVNSSPTLEPTSAARKQ